MPEFILTEDAQHDLAWMYREGLDQFGAAKADKYLDEFYHLFSLLAGMGIDFQIEDKKFSRHTHQSHIIIFELAGGGVKILRVFYGSSDYLRQL